MKKILKCGWRLESLLLAAFIVPMNSQSDWRLLKYKNIPANEVVHAADHMLVRVVKSASPVIFKLPKSQKIKELKIVLKINGELNLTGQQGQKKQDDFVFRLGLVVKGNKKLNFVQKAVAPSWIKELHALAKNDEGIDRIEFFNLCSDKKIVGQKRKHPLSDLITENFVWLHKKSKDFDTYTYKLAQPTETLALWLSLDGDDTESFFEVSIKTIEFVLEDITI